MEEFLEYQFPTNIAYYSSENPDWLIDIRTGEGLYENRILQEENSRTVYSVAKINTDISEIKGLFMACRGRVIPFRFRDWLDYKAVLADLGPTISDGTEFQLKKNYFSGDNYYSKDIKKPVSGTVEIFVDGILQTSGYSVDYTTGIVTFDSPIASGETVTATFEFDKPVRFNSDTLSLQLKTLEISEFSIELIEVFI